MTINCDKVGCDRTDAPNSNYRMYSFKLAGADMDETIQGHLCFEHRKELAKKLNAYLQGTAR